MEKKLTYNNERYGIASQITPHIWIGNRKSCSCEYFAQQDKSGKGFTHIICISADNEHGTYFADTNPEGKSEEQKFSPIRLRIKLLDGMGSRLKEKFVNGLQRSNDFIDTAMKEGSPRILVHCQAGMSRSASMVIGHLMNKKLISFDDAYELVASRRAIDPDPIFRELLKSFGLQNFDYQLIDLYNDSLLRIEEERKRQDLILNVSLQLVSAAKKDPNKMAEWHISSRRLSCSSDDDDEPDSSIGTNCITFESEPEFTYKAANELLCAIRKFITDNNSSVETKIFEDLEKRPTITILL